MSLSVPLRLKPGRECCVYPFPLRVAQGCPGDAGSANWVPGLHRLRLAHYPPDCPDAGQHPRAARHLYGHPVLAGIPVGKEGSRRCPPGLAFKCDHSSKVYFPPPRCCASRKHRSRNPPPRTSLNYRYFLPDCWCHWPFGGGGLAFYEGGWSHVYPPPQAMPSFIHKTLLWFSGLTSEAAAHMQGGSFWSETRVVRDKCRILSYLASGVGKEAARLNHGNHTYSLLLTLLPHQYQIFIPMVNKVMLKHRINHQRYDILICRIVKVRTQPNLSRFSKRKKTFDTTQGNTLLHSWNMFWGWNQPFVCGWAVCVCGLGACFFFFLQYYRAILWLRRKRTL